MPAKKYSVEQIVAKLREHEKLQGQGLTIPQACKRIGIADCPAPLYLVHFLCGWRLTKTSRRAPVSGSSYSNAGGKRC
jgi:hypothetical protein